MSELFRLVIEKRDAEGMDKFIKIIQDHGWKIVLSPSDVQTSLAEFTMHASESHILHSLHLIFAHKDWRKGEWVDVSLYRGEGTKERKDLLNDHNFFTDEVSPLVFSAEKPLNRVF